MSLASWSWLLLLVACTTAKDPAAPMVRVRAEKDLRCPPDQIQVRAELGGKYRADGCGRGAVYDTACEGLQCTVSLEDEEAPGWRDRPTPEEVDYQR